VSVRSSDCEEWKRLALDMGEALRDIARITDEAIQDGHPSLPEMVRVHRRAVAAVDDLIVARLDGIANKEQA